MDPITLIVTALAAGAASGTADAAASAMKDAYVRLRALVAKRLGGRPDAELVLAKHEQAPEMWQAPLMAELAEAAADRDLDLIQAAGALMRLVDEARTPGKYTVDTRGAQGVQIGDRTRQDNVFNAPPGSAADQQTSPEGRQVAGAANPFPGAAPQGQDSDDDRRTVDVRGAMGVQVGAGGTQNIYSSQSFCRCGNSIQFQCQVCGAGMCWTCDVIEWQQRNKTRYGFPRIVVWTSDIGYIKKVEKSGAEWAIDDNRIMKAQLTEGTIVGPFLYSGDVVPVLTAEGLRHVCCACVTAAAVDIAESIVSGTACRIPDCCLQATATCTCCGGSFCTLTFSLGSAHWNLNAEWGEWRTFGSIGSRGQIGWNRSPGLCLTCASEQAEASAEVIIDRLEEYGLVFDAFPGRPPGWTPRFTVPVGLPYKTKMSRRERAEYDKAREKAEEMEKRCFAEIQERIAQLATVTRKCEHTQWFADTDSLHLPVIDAFRLADLHRASQRVDGKLGISRYVGYIYAIVDDRDQPMRTAEGTP
jgi:hypothetical protein